VVSSEEALRPLLKNDKLRCLICGAEVTELSESEALPEIASWEKRHHRALVIGAILRVATVAVVVLLMYGGYRVF